MHQPVKILTRAAIVEQLARFQAGDLNAAALAGWAFKQFADHEDELLIYEPDRDDLIAAVLDDLMWTDAAPFALDAAAAQALADRLQ